jgi:uncharacterized protein involved in outer membrane biogenesis
LLLVLALLVALALGLAAALLLLERTIPLDGLRGRAAAALSRALGAEARIDGPLRLITGLHPGIELEGLRLDATAGDGKWRAEARLARLRLDIWALLGREIVVTAADLQDARLCAALDPQRRAPRVAHGASGWRVGGIEKLRIARVALVAGADCAAEPWARIASLEGGLPAEKPLRMAASGELHGSSWRAELHGPPYAALAAAASTSRFELSAELAGARLQATIDARPSPAAASAEISVDADDLLPLTQLLGAPMKSFGPLSGRAHVMASASRLEMRVEEARIRPASVAGALSLDWSGARPRARIELRSAALDAVALRQWLDASLDRPRLQPGRLMRRIMSAARASDGELALNVARVDAGPAVLEAVGAEGGWSDGVLRVQLTAHYAKSPLTGTLEADMRGEEPALTLEAGARALVLPKEAGLSGSIGRVSAKLSARAAPGALRQAMRGTLEVREARLRLPFGGGRLPPLLITAAQAEWPGGETLRVNGTGSMGEVRAQARAKLGFGGRRPTGDLDFKANADALAGLPLEARGHARVGESDWHVDLASISLGRTRGRATLSGALPPAKRPIAARAEFDVLDLSQFGQRQPKRGSSLWDRELLPRAGVPNAELEIAAARVVLPQNGSMRARGKASLRGGGIAATLEARDLSLPRFGATAGRVTLEASASGATPAEMAAGATLRLEAHDGRVVIRSGAAPLDASVAEARLAAAPEARTTLSAAGAVLELPFDLRASAAPLATLLPAAGGEFDVSGRVGEVALSAAWRRDAPLRVKLDAPRLDAFDALLARRLPRAGPVSLEATVHGLGTLQRSAEVALALGESRASGRIADARANGRHRIDVALDSTVLQLHDMGLQDDKPDSERKSGGSAKQPEAKLKRQLERAEAQMVALRRALREFDGRFALSAARVKAGAAELGRGELTATLEQGRLRVAPLKLDSPKGKLALELGADLSTETARYRLDGELDNFRYGALLSGTEAAGKAEGSLNMKLELTAQGPLDALVRTVSGEADFAVFPTDFTSRALELWGGGLMRSMGAVLDKEKGARINCAVAAFNISGGVARSEALMLDSASTRAAGELEVDLRDHRLQGFMAPQPKSPHLLSPLVPVGIGGTLDKPEVGVDVAGIPRATVRTFYFVPAYLYDAFFGGNMPADGSEDCVKAFHRISTK